MTASIRSEMRVIAEDRLRLMLWKTLGRRNSFQRAPAGAGSALARQALERPPARGIQLRHLLGEVAEGDVAVLVDEALDLGLRPQSHVLVALVGRGVVVGLALASPAEQALLVKPRHDRHVRRVGAFLARAGVERLHHRAHGGLATGPQLLHHLGLELVQRRWGGSGAWALRRTARHLRRNLADGRILGPGRAGRDPLRGWVGGAPPAPARGLGVPARRRQSEDETAAAIYYA